MAHCKSLKLLLVLSFHYAFCKEALNNNCGPGLKSAGYTYPAGDITLEYGEDLDIYCILNDAAVDKYGVNGSQNMSFILGNKKFPSEIVNSTAIRLHIKNHPKTQQSDYYCMVNDDLVCHNIVVVGTKPQNVTDFDCIGHNYENFTCSWTPPENYVTTNYALEYKPELRPLRYTKAKYAFKSSTPAQATTKCECPTNLSVIQVNGETKLSCTWDLSTRPQYRHSHEFFLFSLSANNSLGAKTWTFRIHHFGRVRPSPPEDLVGIPTSPHSIKLEWIIPVAMKSFSPGLEYRISWLIAQNKKWTTVYIPEPDDKSGKRIQFELTNLPYAHCLYDIRVAIKSKVATEERMWSQNNSITVWTSSKLPDCPPNTTAGGFELLEGTGNRLVYWQNIHNYQENGENISYYIRVDEDPTIQPVKVYKNYAEFQNLPDKNYTFRIWSKNTVGSSKESSVVFFPSQKNSLRQLSKLVKVDKGGGEYDLEWTESSDIRVKNYTLFWCSADKERPHPCEGTLQWSTVPQGVKNKTLKLATYDSEKKEKINIYQFAISANGIGTSSGLLWADCTVIPGSGVKLRQTYVKKVNSRFIVLHWKLECIKLGDILSFNVSYCTIATPLSQECQPKSFNYKLFNNHINIGEGELNITGLKPYTGYKIEVKPIIIGVESQFSDPMFNSTLEDTPTEPRNLRIIQRTDRTIKISWEKPLEENGHLLEYVVLINGREERVSNEKEKTVYHKNITALQPRTEYVISVKACTTSGCSSTSKQFATDIGYPGTIPKPSANWDNYSLIIKWEKPDEPGVKVDFYEIQVGTTKGKEEYYLYNTTSQSYEIGICQHDKSQTVYVKIRAVNIKDGRRLQGNWSVKAEFPCFRTAPSGSWIIPLVVMSVIIFIALMCYLAKRIWRKIIDMRNCPVKLPHALDAVVNNFEPKEKHVDDTLPGEPLLSDKLATKPRTTSGETSGCCSGTESVSSTSELTGGSISDSGTEQPRSLSLGEAEHKDVALRQRPNVKKTEYVSMAEIPAAPWSTKPSQSGYSVIGMNAPPKKPDVGSDYMPLSDISSKTSYVPFQPETPTKPPTSGYVPYHTQEPASKNTPYVLAGEPSAKLATKVPPLLTLMEEASPGYVKAASIESTSKLEFWQPAPMENLSKGYVVVGDLKPQKTDLGVQKSLNKGYVPHNIKFDSTKSIKED